MNAAETAAADALDPERLANGKLGNELGSAHADAHAERERMRALDSAAEPPRQPADEAVGLREERDDRELAP